MVRRGFDYDNRELDARVEATDDGPEYWRHEVVSVRAAYGDERLTIHLFLPKNVDPPYQAVVYFPPSSARYLTDSTNPSFPFGYFIPEERAGPGLSDLSEHLRAAGQAARPQRPSAT